MATVTLALVQMRCEKGAIDANLAAMKAYLRAAGERGAEIVCFPEASITGYVSAATDPDALLAVDGPEVARFVAMTRAMRVTALAGIIERNPGGKPYITQVVARDGAVLAVYRKVTIPDDEAHFYTPGSDAPPVWRHPLRRVPPESAGAEWAYLLCGTAICADIANPRVFAENASQGARLIFEAAAPGLYGEQATRDWHSGYAWWRGECFTKLGGYARELGVTIAVATQAGRTRDEDFPGGGYVFGPDGACVAESSDWSEGVLYATVEIG
ncbi:MAG: carbon-nitrogen hydrolase family protein [Ktedonobacterales bacterium]